MLTTAQQEKKKSRSDSEPRPNNSSSTFADRQSLSSHHSKPESSTDAYEKMKAECPRFAALDAAILAGFERADAEKKSECAGDVDGEKEEDVDEVSNYEDAQEYIHDFDYDSDAESLEDLLAAFPAAPNDKDAASSSASDESLSTKSSKSKSSSTIASRRGKTSLRIKVSPYDALSNDSSSSSSLCEPSPYRPPTTTSACSGNSKPTALETTFDKVQDMYNKTLVVEQAIARWDRMYADSLGLEDIVGGELSAQLESSDDDDEDEGQDGGGLSTAGAAVMPHPGWF
ncbi:hypothetical protein PG997_010725 [Apiospora hydei]|uniref:Uncharacterized protein n=1 Tax=Apiospora hydei TaxID=1337664 RepID=A0ABR1VI13_9PEZI